MDEQQGGALPFRQRGDRDAYPAPALVLRKLVVGCRIRGDVRQLGHCQVAVPAVPVDGEVVGDPIQPRRKADPAWLPASGFPPDPQKRLLREIFRVVPVS